MGYFGDDLLISWDVGGGVWIGLLFLFGFGDEHHGLLVGLELVVVAFADDSLLLFDHE